MFDEYYAPNTASPDEKPPVYFHKLYWFIDSNHFLLFLLISTPIVVIS
jgi:hypothetical protein